MISETIKNFFLQLKDVFLNFNFFSISKSALLLATRSHALNKWGYSATMSSVCRPIEPVLPKMAIFLIGFTYCRLLTHKDSA